MPTDISGEIEGKRATEDNPLSVSIFDNGKVCNNNSTDVLLLAGETYTGIVGDLLNYGVLILGVNADVPSATDGVKFDFSPDGTNWYNTDNYTYLDNGVTKVYTMTPIFRYYRIRYVNGASDQTSFHLQTVLKKTYIKPSSHKIQDTLADEDDGELQVSVLKLRTAQDTYVSAASTTSGNFKVSLEEYEAGANPVRKDLFGGGKVAVGTTAVEMTLTGATTSILLKADILNTDILYIGKSDVTNLGANAFTFLYPGDEIVIDYDDVDNPIYVVGAAASQNVWKGALL